MLRVGSAVLPSSSFRMHVGKAVEQTGAAPSSQASDGWYHDLDSTQNWAEAVSKWTSEDEMHMCMQAWAKYTSLDAVRGCIDVFGTATFKCRQSPMPCRACARSGCST
jgi:hypothetical protein